MDWIWVIVGTVVAWYVVATIVTRLFVREGAAGRGHARDDIWKS